MDLTAGVGFFRGRVALAAILKAFGLRPGDSVALQAFTCSALAEALAYCGLKPQWVDIKLADYTMDPADLARKIDGSTKAVIVQHSYGFVADMDAIAAVCAERGLPLIEDCCHTVSSLWRGKGVGTLADAAFYSFESGKPLVAGLGGWGVVNRVDAQAAFAAQAGALSEPPRGQQVKIRAMYEAFRLLYSPRTFWQLKRTYRWLRDKGLLKSNYNADDVEAPLFDAEEFGWRLGKLQESVLQRVAKKATAGDARRREIAGWYEQDLRGRFVLPSWDASRSEPVLIRYPVQVEEKPRALALLESRSIEASDNYSTPVHPYTGTMLRRAGYEDGACPNAEFAGARVVALSCAPGQARSDIQRTTAAILEIAA